MLLTRDTRLASVSRLAGGSHLAGGAASACKQWRVQTRWTIASVPGHL